LKKSIVTQTSFTWAKSWSKSHT